MTDKTKNTVQYRFSSAQIRSVFAFLSTLVGVDLGAVIALSIRAWPIGITKETLVIVGIVWLLLITSLVMEIWWCRYARYLEGTKELKIAKLIGFCGSGSVVMLVATLLCFLIMEKIAPIFCDLAFAHFLFGADALFTILGVYANYHRDYPQHTIDFITYCNQTVKNN